MPYSIAVVGDRDSVMGFRALGLDVRPAETAAEGAEAVRALADGGCAIIYITERLASELAGDIDKYKDRVMPAVIVIPGKEGSGGLGLAALKSAVERAVGADIMNT
ncbi:MAG: V-type ATP synthase subunit F [Oscillospiraceae bacterium]|nr:V-type ATP synthase subunit F [Oscillospiraceae bacterium]